MNCGYVCRKCSSLARRVFQAFRLAHSLGRGGWETTASEAKTICPCASTLWPRTTSSPRIRCSSKPPSRRTISDFVGDVAGPVRLATLQLLDLAGEWRHLRIVRHRLALDPESLGMSLEGGRDGTQPFGTDRAVVVSEGEQLAASMTNGEIASGSHFSPRLIQVSDRQAATTKLFDDAGRVVGRAIVDHKYFPTLICQVSQRLEKTNQESRAISRGDDYRDEGVTQDPFTGWLPPQVVLHPSAPLAPSQGLPLGLPELCRSAR